MKYEYSPSLQPCEYHGIPGKLKKPVCNHVLALLVKPDFHSDLSSIADAIFRQRKISQYKIKLHFLTVASKKSEAR